jgi:hypothetical protein
MKNGKFHVDMFTSLENQIPLTLSITILVFVEQSRSFLSENQISRKRVLQRKCRLYSTKTNIVTDRVDGI